MDNDRDREDRGVRGIESTVRSDIAIRHLRAIRCIVVYGRVEHRL